MAQWRMLRDDNDEFLMEYLMADDAPLLPGEQIPILLEEDWEVQCVVKRTSIDPFKKAPWIAGVSPLYALNPQERKGENSCL